MCMHAADILIDEHTLVLRLIEGDENAFCELYAAYKNRLIYFAMRFLKSREYAEDVFQDAFAVVWQTRRFINPDTSFSSYLYTIVRNRILNQLRDLANQDKLREQIFSQAVDYTTHIFKKEFYCWCRSYFTSYMLEFIESCEIVNIILNNKLTEQY